MTNAERDAAAESAKQLIALLAADLEAVQGAADDAARRFADMLGNLSCCISNTISAAKKVTLEPKAAIIRDLKASEQHLEFYGRKNTRNMRSLLLKALGADFEGAIMRADIRAQTEEPARG